VNTKNLEKFLDLPQTDDSFYRNINKELPIGSANGLAYVNDGYGAVLKIQFIKKLYGQVKLDDEEEKKKSGTFTHTGRLGEVFAEST
jgi:ATP-dependent Lon protease